MNSFLHLFSGSVVESFSLTLIHSLWQGALWSLLVLALMRVISTTRPQARYLACLVCLYGMVVGVCVTWSLLRLPSSSSETLSFATVERMTRVELLPMTPLNDPGPLAVGRHEITRENIHSSTKLELLPTAAHTVRFVDPEGRPVPNLSFGISVFTEGTHWITTGAIAVAQLTSGQDGTVTIPWIPLTFEYADVDLFEEDWRVGNVEQTDAENTWTTITVRRKHKVEGRLVMPAGVSAEGLLIQAKCHGPAGRGDSNAVRARGDGSFSISIWSDQCYYLSVIDTQWGSDCWTGVILATEDADQTEVYGAQPEGNRPRRERGTAEVFDDDAERGRTAAKRRDS